MKAFYAGSFDPFTIGHLSVALRAVEMFGDLIIGIGYNEKKRNETLLENRKAHIEKLFADNKNVKVIVYDRLTAEVAKENGAGVLVRGVRNSFDFEKEKELADINLKVFGIPTAMLPAEPDLSYISSSMVRELRHFGYDVSDFIAGDNTLINM